jgi:RHS repeat-associated protein
MDIREALVNALHDWIGGRCVEGIAAVGNFDLVAEIAVRRGDRIEGATHGPDQILVVYDPFGRRAAKTLSGVTTEFLYDGPNPMQELNGSSPPSPLANLLTGLNIDEYFTRSDASGAMNFLTDALGSAVALTDSAGNINTSYSYEPFGNVSLTGSSANPYQFTGRENDGTGLYFYRARYYSPTLQRFVAQDPILFRGGDANLYGYVMEDPTSGLDPYGLDAYLCHRPIQGFSQEYGRWHHEYVCVVSNGQVDCGGLTTNGSLFGGAGEIEPDQFKPSTCNRVSQTQCMDECLSSKLNNMAPPTYNLLNMGGGENCQGFAAQIINSCQSQCMSAGMNLG